MWRRLRGIAGHHQLWFRRDPVQSQQPIHQRRIPDPGGHGQLFGLRGEPPHGHRHIHARPNVQDDQGRRAGRHRPRGGRGCTTTIDPDPGCETCSSISGIGHGKPSAGTIVKRRCCAHDFRRSSSISCPRPRHGRDSPGVTRKGRASWAELRCTTIDRKPRHSDAIERLRAQHGYACTIPAGETTRNVPVPIVNDIDRRG